MKMEPQKITFILPDRSFPANDGFEAGSIDRSITEDFTLFCEGVTFDAAHGWDSNVPHVNKMRFKLSDRNGKSAVLIATLHPPAGVWKVEGFPLTLWRHSRRRSR